MNTKGSRGWKLVLKSKLNLARNLQIVLPRVKETGVQK
jgi:hypothetical protein